MPARVCHVLAGAKGGVWMVEQLRELRRRHGYEVFVVVGEAEGPLIDLLEAEGIPFHVATFATSPTHLWRGFRAAIELAKHFRRMRFDVVQSHVFMTTLTARPAAWIAGVPLRLAMVAGPFHLEAAATRWLDGATCWMESALIASCEKIRNAYREMGVAEARLELIHYGVDARKFDSAPAAVSGPGIRARYGWPEGTPVIALVSWFYTRLYASLWVPEALHDLGLKGQEDFVLAASLVRSVHPDARFLLVGGPFDDAGRTYMEDVQALVRSLHLDEYVVFTGHCPDVQRVLREVDIAVQASLSESCGGTIEGLLAELPMVATRVGGMVDTVRDGETGVLVEPDNPHDLARGLLELLADPARARTLGRNGRRLMLEEFSLDRTVSDLHALYSRRLADVPAGRRGRGRGAFLWRSVVALLVSAWCMARWAVGERMGTWAARPGQRPLRHELRRWNAPGDIGPAESLAELRLNDVLPENGLFLGPGWHSLERDTGHQPFRWLETDGEILVTRPTHGPRRIVLFLEPGPGQDYRPFELRLVDERGVEIDRVRLAERCEIAFTLPLGLDEVTRFRLKAPKGVPLAIDRRIMNLRVFRMSWAPAPVN